MTQDELHDLAVEDFYALRKRLRNLKGKHGRLRGRSYFPEGEYGIAGDARIEDILQSNLTCACEIVAYEKKIAALLLVQNDPTEAWKNYEAERSKIFAEMENIPSETENCDE